MMTEPELAALTEAIRDNRFQLPIILFEGKILDGRNRRIACEKAGVTPRTEVFKGSKAEALKLVWSLNVRRRHLTSGQVAQIEDRMYEECPEYRQLIDAEQQKARERQCEGGRKAGRGRPRKEKVPSNLTEPIIRGSKETRSFRAKIAGTSAGYISTAAEIREKSPELAGKEHRKNPPTLQLPTHFSAQTFL
jgi:hypothetical protein